MSQLIDPKAVTHVWYHANCADGFAAALAAWYVLGDDATYEPVRHGRPEPEISPDANLAIVDFAYPREQLLKIADRVSSLVVLDHHRSAARDLEGLPFALFDLEKSGARMAWEYWHPGEECPEFIAYVEDRDLWNWKLPESREVALALSQEPFDFGRWSRLSMKHLRSSGKALLGFQNRLVKRAVGKMHWTVLEEHRIPVVNSLIFQSEIGDELCKKYPEAPFSGVYYNKGEIEAWSLRSIGEFDVSEIAARFGGGGHRNASGFARPSQSVTQNA